jgi:hypothetical protein
VLYFCSEEIPMKKALTLFFLFAFNAFIFAAAPGSDVMFVKGNVTDKTTHESLAGVEVTVKGTSIVVYTDFDGNFFLPDLPSGSYQLDFHYITYESSVAVTDNCDHCTTLSVELQEKQ